MSPRDVSKDLDLRQGRQDDIDDFKERWEFDRDVTEVFDDMIERSIPQYNTMRELTWQIGRGFTQRRPYKMIFDFGCSTGIALKPFATLSHVPRCIGFEKSPPMLEAARRNFEGHDNVAIVDYDLADKDAGMILPFGFEAHPGSASLVLSVLTLQFIPINYRQDVIEWAYKLLDPGCALILVEKVLGYSSEIDKLLIDLYHHHKRHMGYSQEQVERKALSLEGVLVPMQADFNVALLNMAGFRKIDCYWRWLNFAAWIAIK